MPVIKTSYEDLTGAVLLATLENAIEDVDRLYYSGKANTEEAEKAKRIKFLCKIEMLNRLEARE